MSLRVKKGAAAYWNQRLTFGHPVPLYSLGATIVLMKCPHCAVGIHNNLAMSSAVIEPQINSGDGRVIASRQWYITHQRCPECFKSIVYLSCSDNGGPDIPRFLAYPRASTRPVPPEVTDPYRQDFVEACTVLPFSPKASAALSRRCLQAILKDKAGAKKRDLADQIDEVASSGSVPSHIADDLHAVRNIGNFAAHTQKSTATGAILDVEEGEAEWNLDVLELLFDFYFVQPAISARRKAALNQKLQQAGKPPIK